MKKIFLYLFFFVTLISTPSYSKIVYIDINKILNDSKAGKNALLELEKNIKLQNSKFSTKEKELLDEEKKIITQKNILSEKDFNEKLSILNKKVNDYKLYKNSEIKKINEKKNFLRNKFLEILNPILAEYASTNGIDIIIRKEQIIVGKTELDVSNTILNIVDKKIKKIN